MDTETTMTQNFKSIEIRRRKRLRMMLIICVIEISSGQEKLYYHKVLRWSSLRRIMAFVLISVFSI